MELNKSVDLTMLGTVPLFTLEDIMQHLEFLDKEVFLALCEDLEEKDRTKPAVLKWLFIQHQTAYLALEDLERAWEAAWNNAIMQRETIFRMYFNQKHLAEENFQMKHMLTDGQDEVWEESFTLDNRAAWFTSKEPWTIGFAPQEYFMMQNGRQRKESLAFLQDGRKWQTFYHCHGKWAMEQLAEVVRADGYEAVCLKRNGVKADFDMLRWKVVTTEPFDGAPNKKRKT